MATAPATDDAAFETAHADDPPNGTARPDDPPTKTARPGRRIGLLAVLRVLGLARRAVPRPVTGPKAYVQWWQRVLALLALVVLVVALGLAFAAAVGLMVVVAGFLLEQAIA